MKRLIFAALTAVLIMSSCVSAEKLTLIDVKEPQSLSGSELNIEFTVENLNSQNIKLKDAKFDISCGGSVIAQVMAPDDIVIPKRSVSEITVPLRIHVRDLLGAINISKNPELIEEAIISGEVIVKSGVLRKKFTITDIPAKSLSDMLDQKINN